jgi:DNA segregation ATPase FtsK/SpoIIIE and related proteins
MRYPFTAQGGKYAAAIGCQTKIVYFNRYDIMVTEVKRMPKGATKQPAPKPRQMPKKSKPIGEAAGVIFIALGIFLGVCVFVKTDTGLLGGAFRDVLFGLFGLYVYPVPFAFVALGVGIIAARNKKVSVGRTVLLILLVISMLSLTHTFILSKLNLTHGFFSYVEDSYRMGLEYGAGSGAVGCLLVYPCNLLIGSIGCIIFFITMLLVSVLVLTNLSIRSMSRGVVDAGRRTVEKVRESAEQRKRNKLYIEDLRDDEDEPLSLPCEPEPPRGPELLNRQSFRKKKPMPNYFDDEQYTIRNAGLAMPGEAAPVYRSAEPQGTPQMRSGGLSIEEPIREPIRRTPAAQAGQAPESAEAPARRRSSGAYRRPPISLLTRAEEQSKNAGAEEQRRTAMLIEETLTNFGVDAQVVHTVRGPAVTRYELRPAPGVRVKRIKELENDIAMNLAAKAVKIEAPIPGKAAVGVEVPNSDVTFVHLRALLESEEFRKAPSPLTFALGKDISGKNYYVDIAKMPHILIAGETGSGKSVCINSMITSLIYKASPDELKLVLIDPKVVELSTFKAIPHLLVPVVTDPKKAASALNWAVSEMNSRYKVFAERGAREITRFNQIIGPDETALPHIVVIIDELAELMMSSPREVEDSICRIAQLGRAAGIHLVVATQRPSVNVITGVIKANISSRIAFKVNSGVDSRTILDQNGAEKLLRNGDMLYHPSGAPKPVRLQGCYVSDADIEAVTEYVASGNEAEFNEEFVNNLNAPEDDGPEDDEMDPMLPRAVEIVLEYGQASISMLQRRLRIGYARAGHLVDQMEQRHIVSSFEGSKARQVLITRDAFLQMFGMGEE